MEDAIGMGNSLNLKSGSNSLGCKMSAQSAGTVNGWACDRVNCSSYGKWWCPFSW
ncbi:hypothetical protein [Methanobacterium sp. SMA-27]|uniref:hypothetical protein n=1 Tax=Methanobacterium sp. SMA-27 TaxID=1495336 RepID=UPI000AF3497B|nr:hypothetical protein [Methanobacterium sp. SMA-27]